MVGAAPRAALATHLILGWRVAASGGRWREDKELKGRPETGELTGGIHFRVSGLGWSGNRYGFPGSGTGAGLNLYLVLNTRTRDLRPRPGT